MLLQKTVLPRNQNITPKCDDVIMLTGARFPPASQLTGGRQKPVKVTGPPPPEALEDENSQE